MGGIGRGEEGDTGRMLRRDGSESGAEVWVVFVVTEEFVVCLLCVWQ